MALSIENLPLAKKSLHTPPLQEVADVLSEGLKTHFSQVQVEVVECPDLMQEPFTLANKGLHGNPRLVEVGSPSFLLPLVNREKLYDIRDITKLSEINPAFVIGAGAGPFNYAKSNCEGILNLNVNNGEIDQHSRIAKINLETGDGIQEVLNNSVTEFALLANLFLSEGKPGKVIRVRAAKRTGNEDFIATLRTTLAQHYGSKVVGLGGTFLIKEGKAKTHIMPDFSTTPINSDEDLNKWLRFFNMSAPLVAVGTFVTSEFEGKAKTHIMPDFSTTPINSDEDLNKWLRFFNMSAPLVAVGTFVTSEFDLDLRVQHFHMFSHHGEAGHYHIDTTPDIVEYIGYFNIAEHVYRIDKPAVSQNYGKD